MRERIDYVGHFEKFWNCYPALLYGLCMLLGFYTAFQWSWSLTIPLGVLFIPQCVSVWHNKGAYFFRCVLTLLLFLAALAYGICCYQFPSIGQDCIQGTAHISISSLQVKTTHYGCQWSYRGGISNFFPDGPIEGVSIARNITYSLSLPCNESIHRPSANQDYVVHGILRQTGDRQYMLKISPNEPWHPVKGSWSLAEYRYHTKKAVKEYISRNISNPHSAAFLGGLATGEFESRIFSFEFGRFGLQHIMAISGFHFCVIAGILSIFLRFVLSRKRGSAILILLLSSYFLFLGCSPSIMRAWIAILIGLGSHLIEKRASAINSLGVALLVILLLDPLACLNIGFQFSFLTTAAILLLYSGCSKIFERFLTKRPLSQLVEMNLWNQHGYYIFALFRQGVALGLAVNLVAMPVTLYYFQKFPWMSLLYNLFFPMLVSGAMFLLLIGMLLVVLLPFAADWIHALNSRYTQWILNFTFNMPTSLDVYLRVDPIPSWIIISYLCAIFVGSIFVKNYLELKREQMQDLAFL